MIRRTILQLNGIAVLLVVVVFLGFKICLSLVVLLAVLLRYFRLPRTADVENKISRFFATSDCNDAADGPRSGRMVIAHRGGSVEAPENTIEAIVEAKNNGADGVEIDLEFTRDCVPVLMHDDTVDRTTDKTGKINRMMYSEVCKLDASAKHSLRDTFKNARIPTLEEALKECMHLEMKVFLDCKGYPSQTAKVVHDMFQKYPGLYSSVVVCSFHPDVIYAVRKADPNIMTGLTHRHCVLSLRVDQQTLRNKELWKQVLAPMADFVLEWSHYLWFWYLCGTSFFLVNKNSLSKNDMKFWQKLGIHVVAWTVNKPLEKAFFLDNLKCSIITDSMDPEYCEEQST